MSEINVPNSSDYQISCIIKKNKNLKYYEECPVVTINIANDEYFKLLNICNNEENSISTQTNVPKPQKETTLLNENSQIEYRVLRPEDLQLRPTTLINNTIKKNKQTKAYLDDKIYVYDSLDILKKTFRTRSGRMSKPPKHIDQTSEDSAVSTINEVKEKTLPVEEKNKVIITKSNKSTTKRSISAQFRCGTCNKAYLGYNKMSKHLKLNPDHIAPLFSKKFNEPNLWNQLLRKTKEAPKAHQTRIFCEELVSFMQNANTLISKLLKSADEKESNSFAVNSSTSNLLGIPEGNYLFEDTNEDIEMLDKTINDNKNSFEETTALNECLQMNDCIQNVDQNSLFLLDTGQVNFDSSVSSEEVINVDQLVNERLNTLTGGGELESINNTTQNITLDLSMDMFPYHTSE